jgi:hypothetical protein
MYSSVYILVQLMVVKTHFALRDKRCAPNIACIDMMHQRAPACNEPLRTPNNVIHATFDAQ